MIISARSYSAVLSVRTMLAMCLVALCLSTWVLPTWAQSQSDRSQAFEITYQKRVLGNGLTVIVHEDHKAPIVAVGVWYHVGSGNEPEGKSGYAHLFEHLMFEGTENFDEEYTRPLEAVGATQVNGSTWLDRTNYIQNVPSQALELALWMESDRMGHLLGAVTQDKLDQQRQAVINEKQQGDNEPYGMAGYRILEGLFPMGHPYRHDSIGSVDDLEAASLEDVQQWFRSWYGAANAVLVLAGDIEADQGFSLAERFFGHIPAGPPLQKLDSWVPDRRITTRESMHDRVPHIRSYRYWAVPGRTAHDRAYLELAAEVLGGGKNSRLYQALVYQNQYAVDLEVIFEPHELASLFSIEVTLAPDSSQPSLVAALARVDSIVDQEMSRFLSDGPGSRELSRAKAVINAAWIRSLEEIGGFSGKATVLARGELYAGDPGFVNILQDWISQASKTEVRDAARRWLNGGRHQVDVLPFGEHQIADQGVNRESGPPVAGTPSPLAFPEVQRARLTNGMEVILASRHSVPLVNVSVQFDAGFAADHGGLAGTASFVLAMLDENTHTRNALEIDAEARTLGAEIWTSSTLDSSTVNLSALSGKLAPSIELLADIVCNPVFTAENIEKLRKRWFAVLEQELSDPLSIALRTMPPLLYGEQHPYGIPFTGSGNAASISAIESDTLTQFHSHWLRPDNGVIFVTGDTDLATILPALEESFGHWRSPALPLPSKNIAPVETSVKGPILIVDKPGAEQSLILAAQLAPPSGKTNDLDMEVMNDIIGGTYNARINQTLRVKNNWSYGAFSLLNDARGQRPWMIYAPVQTDHTTDAILTLSDEVAQFVGDHPATPEELAHHIDQRVNSLPGRFETNSAVMEILLDNQRFGRPDGYPQALSDNYHNVTLDSVQSAAARVLNPDELTWVVIGDRSVIEDELIEAFGARVAVMGPDGAILTRE